MSCSDLTRWAGGRVYLDRGLRTGSPVFIVHSFIRFLYDKFHDCSRHSMTSLNKKFYKVFLRLLKSYTGKSILRLGT